MGSSGGILDSGTKEAGLRDVDFSVHPELVGLARFRVGGDFGCGFQLPNIGINLGKIRISARNFCVDVRYVHLVHYVDGRLVDRRAAYDECPGSGLRLTERLLQRTDAADAGNVTAGQHYVLAARKRPADGLPGAAAHDHGAAQGGALEVLQILRNVPGKSAPDADRTVVGNGHYKTFFHTTQQPVP